MRIVRLLIPVLFAIGCKPSSASRLNYLLEPVGSGSDPASKFFDAAERRKVPVVIYYLNESHYALENGNLQNQKNFQWVRRMLMQCARSAPNSEITRELLTLRDRLFSDLTNFQEAYSSELDDLKAHFSAEGTNPRGRLVVFTNNSMKYNQTFQTCGDTDGVDTPHTLEHPSLAKAGPVYQSQPLMHPDVFAAAIRKVGELYPSSGHRYVLISKSHGNSEMALTAFLAKDFTSMPQGEFCEAMVSHFTGTTQTATNSVGKDTGTPMGKDTGTPMGKDTGTPMGKGGLAAEIAEQAINARQENVSGKTSALPGITKRRYLEIVAANADAGMYFPLIFVESCNSDMSSALNGDSPFQSAASRENVGFIYASDDQGLDYQTLDYKTLLKSLEATDIDLPLAF